MQSAGSTTLVGPSALLATERYNIRLRPALLSCTERAARGRKLMPTDIIMPQMGESIVEGTITKWLKKPGDKVQRDEPLFEISTDKVDAEIPAPASGVLQEIKVTEGTTVNVNTIVGTIAVDGEAAAAPAKAAPAAPSKDGRKKVGRQENRACPRRRPSRPLPPLTKTKKKPAPPRSSAKSLASTASVSRKSPAPDSAAASPSRTSNPSSITRDRNPLDAGRTQSSVQPSAARQHPHQQFPRHVPPLPRHSPATSFR